MQLRFPVFRYQKMKYRVSYLQSRRQRIGMLGGHLQCRQSGGSGQNNKELEKFRLIKKESLRGGKESMQK